MKNLKYLGLIVFTLFSFIYTEKIANLTLKKNTLYQEIENNKNNYLIEVVNATINGNTIIPGLNGREVSVKDSYFNMKYLNAFNDNYLIYDILYPSISLENNKDLIITKGNSLKREVAFILEYDKDILAYFNDSKIKANILVTLDNIENYNNLEYINNDKVNFKKVESIINNYHNSNICYYSDLIKDTCLNNNKYLVKTNIILDNNSIYDLKDNIENGDIIYIKKNTKLSHIKTLINSILYKDIDIVYLSELISEERD